MDKDELVKRRDELGPWVADNIDLGHGVFTMRPGLASAAEARVARTVQILSDLLPDVSGSRILDLGALEGGFAVELARRGAHVVAVEGRAAHVAKITLAKEALGLDTLEIAEGDVRTLDPAALGTFDAVLCLGILYHLEALDAVRLIELVAACARRLAIVETQVSLVPRSSFEDGATTYWGSPYPEDTAQPAASLDNPESFWLTRASLLNLLTRCGFTSVAESLAPYVPGIAAYRDHVTLVAAKGEPQHVTGLPPTAQSWPERLVRVAHPSQGLRWRIQDAVLRRRGRGLAAVFKSRGERG